MIKSGFIGVYEQSKISFSARIKIEKSVLHIKTTKTAIEAAYFYDKYINDFKIKGRRINNLSKKEIGSIVFHKKDLNDFRGVFFDNHRKRWTANRTMNRKLYHLGFFMHKEYAALAYNNFLIEHGLEREINDLSHVDFSKIKEPKKIMPSSRFYGVIRPKGKLIWTAKIKVDGKGIHIGQYVHELEAAKAVNDFIDNQNLDFAKKNIFTEQEMKMISRCTYL
jgi:hypothetical protein